MVICSKCGFRNDDGVEFCANPKGCGAFLAYVGKKTEALSGGVTIAIAPAMIAVKPGEDFEEPLGMLSGTVIYAALANFCYTLGWVVDTVLYNGRPRRRLYRSGMILAVVLTAPHGGFGGTDAAPIAANVIRDVLRGYP